MSRTAQDVLEFDKLRELLRLRTTCAPGRRAVDALAPMNDRAALEAAFALIREAREWLRGGRRTRIRRHSLIRRAGSRTSKAPASFSSRTNFWMQRRFSRPRAWLKRQFKEDAAKFPLLAARAARSRDFRDLLDRNPACDSAQWRNQRRCVAGAAPHSREHQRDARIAFRKRSSKSCARATPKPAKITSRCATIGSSFRCAPKTAARVPGVVHGASATGQTVFLEPLETVESNNQLVQLAEEEAAEIVRILRELTERLQVMREPLLARLPKPSPNLTVLFARGRFAHDFDATMPEFSDADELRARRCAPSRARRQTSSPRSRRSSR